jgi:hypothetical protein
MVVVSPSLTVNGWATGTIAVHPPPGGVMATFVPVLQCHLDLGHDDDDLIVGARRQEAGRERGVLSVREREHVHHERRSIVTSVSFPSSVRARMLESVTLAAWSA